MVTMVTRKIFSNMGLDKQTSYLENLRKEKDMLINKTRTPEEDEKLKTLRKLYMDLRDINIRKRRRVFAVLPTSIAGNLALSDILDDRVELA